MTRSEQVGRAVASGIEKHPFTARIIGCTVVVAMLAIRAALLWRDFSRCSYMKVFIISGIAIYGGVKAYRSARRVRTQVEAD